MAIAPTGAIYKSLVFDGEDSRNYGVYITGEAVYNAPGRDVEMVEIPGRNGSFALDKGRFQNIEVTYPAGIFADNEADFAEAISDFRNFLCSRRGYVRLTDEYNPNEYRMAIYKSGLEVSPAQLKAGEFDIVFDCKPQRWLTSGETAVTVSSGGTINNPTLFEAKPVIKFRGYGDIVLSGQHINVDSVTIGKVLLSNGGRTNVEYYSYPRQPRGMQEVTSYKIDTNSLNAGDDIVLGLSSFTYTVTATYYYDHMIEADATNQIGSGSSTTAKVQTDKTAVFITEFEPITFQNGTAKTVSAKYWLHYKYGDDGSYTDSTNPNTEIRIVYNGSDTITVSAYAEEASGSRSVFGSCVLGTTTGNSTVQASGDITIDLDTGESYWVRNGQKISADYAVRMGANLPTLKAGNNVITYDNTITQFKVTPRWWRL